MRMNFGKKDEIGEIDFGKIRSDIKQDDVAKDNEALKSIFSKFDKNADGVLSREEIDGIEEALRQAKGDDDNLSTREAKTLFDSKNKKEDVKNLFLFLKNLATTTAGIKSVSNPNNQEGVKEEILYENGNKEILYEDGSKVIETQIAEKSVVSKFNSKGKLVQVVETEKDGTVKTTDFDENGNLKKEQTVKNNGNYVETTKVINGKTLTTIENKELGLVQEYVEGELVKETRGKTVIQYHGSSRSESTTDGDWKQVDNFENDVLKSRTVSTKTEDGKSKVTTIEYDGENSVSNTRIDGKNVSQTKVVDGTTYTVNYDGEGNTKVIVQNGESISALAKKFGCTVEEIISANPDKVKGHGANAYFLVGEEIKIPRELEADLPALQNRKSAEGAQADYKAYDDAIKAEQARQAEQAAAEAEAAQAEAERAEEKQQREAEKARARELAQQFYDIADHNVIKSMDKMLAFLNSNINSSNIVDFLNAYTDPDIRKNDRSIIHTIVTEYASGSAWNPIAWANGSKKQKAVLTKIIDTLCQAAREAGVSEDTINSLRNEFISSMNEELDNAKKKTDPTKMEIALDSLLGQIAAAKSGVEATSEEEAMQAVAGDFKETNDKAQADFDKAREEDSWIAKAGDTICGWFGCNTVEEMRAKLGDNAIKVEKLIEAANKGDKAEFKRIYKELFGVEFDPNLIAASEKANEDYMNAIIAQSQVEKMSTALSQINDSMSFEEIANVIKNLYSNDSEINADEVINEIIKMYADAGYPASTGEEKKAILLDFVNSTKEANQAVLEELTANKTLDELARDAELIGKSAFGTNDISKMVNEFNQNMVMTDAIGTAAVEIGATVLLQFVPGLGQMAAARLAVSAARWGVKGAKIAKYATKAGKFFKAASKLQSGTATASKVVNATTRVVTQAVAAGVATASVGASKHEDTKTILHRALMNASFAGAGAASNMIAPKLMQAFNISNQLATEIAEEIINAAAAYGISTVHGEAYGTQDAFLDFITGLVMARVAGAGAARSAIKGAEIDVNTSKPDVDVNKNQDIGYDWTKAPEIETKFNPDGTTTVSAYENGRLVGKAVKDADGNVIKEYKYEYDADGNVKETDVTPQKPVAEEPQSTPKVKTVDEEFETVVGLLDNKVNSGDKLSSQEVEQIKTLISNLDDVDKLKDIQFLLDKTNGSVAKTLSKACKSKLDGLNAKSSTVADEPEVKSETSEDAAVEDVVTPKESKKAERKARANKLKELRAKLGNKLARAYVKIENAIKNMKNAIDFNKISTSIRTKFANFKTEMNELLDKLNAKVKSLRESIGASEPEWVKSKKTENIDPKYRRTSDEINPNEFVRENGNNGKHIDDNYVQASKDLRDYYNNAIASGAYEGSYENYVRMLQESHRIAYGGKSGRNTWYNKVGQGSLDVNPGVVRGEGSPVSNRIKEGKFVEDIARRYGDEYSTNKITKVNLPGISDDALPYNLYTQHFYPDGKHLDQYFKQMQRTGKEILDLIKNGASQDRILAKIAEHYQYAANARPFGQINNSLFMNEVNTFLSMAGMKTMPHGMLDHAAQRLQPDAFKKYFIDEYKRTALDSPAGSSHASGGAESAGATPKSEYNRNTARAEAYAKFDKNQRSINLKGEGSLSRNAQYALDMNDLPELYLYDGTYLDFSQGELRARIENLAEGDFFTIGRQGDVVVGNKYISRQHILVTRHNGQIVIKDISANGGTYARTRNSGSANNNRKQASVDPKSNMISVFNKYLSDDMKLSNNATPEEVKKAYRKLSVENHPDKFSTDAEKRQHEEIFKVIASAYDDYVKSIRK